MITSCAAGDDVSTGTTGSAAAGAAGTVAGKAGSSAAGTSAGGSLSGFGGAGASGTAAGGTPAGGSAAGGSAAGGSAAGGSAAGGSAAGGSAAGGSTTCPDIGCPMAGSSMVTVCPPNGGPFCIDRYETTRAQYEAFLATGQLSKCAPSEVGVDLNCAKQIFSPTGLTPDHPQTCIRWCGAHDYCASLGKRLCSRHIIGAASSGVDEWYAACGGSGGDPFGGQVGAKCNVAANEMLPVGSKPDCQGAIPGVFDLVGNVSEWTDNCFNGNCAGVGASYQTPALSAACESGGALPVDQTRPYLGLRCCAL